MLPAIPNKSLARHKPAARTNLTLAARFWDRDSMVQASPGTDRHLSQAPTPQQTKWVSVVHGALTAQTKRFPPQGATRRSAPHVHGKDTIALAWNTSALSLDGQERSRHGVERVQKGVSCEEPLSQLQSTPTAPPLRPPKDRKAGATAYVANTPPSVRPDPPPETQHPSRAMGQTISISMSENRK